MLQLYPMANGGQGAGGGRRQRSRVTEMRHRCSKGLGRPVPRNRPAGPNRCRASALRNRAGTAWPSPVPRERAGAVCLSRRTDAVYPTLRDRSSLRSRASNLRLPVAPASRRRVLVIFSQIHHIHIYKRKLLIKNGYFQFFFRYLTATEPISD